MESHLLIVILTIAFGAVVTLYVYLRSFIRFVYLASKVPGPSLWEFLTVHAVKLLNVDKMMDAFITLAETSDYKPYGMWFKIGHFGVVVNDAESVRDVFRNTCMKTRAGPLFDVVSDYLGKGLITLNGDDHRRHRRLLSPPFRKTALEGHLPQINEEVSLLIERIREGTGSDVVNFESLLQEKVMTVVSLLLTGKSSRAYEDDYKTYYKVARMISEIIKMQWFNPFWMFIKWTKSIRTKLSCYSEAVDRLEKILFEKELPAFLKQMENSGEPSNIAECVARQQLGEDGLTNGEIMAEVRHIFGASAETTDFAECVCLYLLALHPDVQERVYDEVESILGGIDRAVEPEDLSRMVYLDMVIKEAFRLFPPIPTMARKVDEETYLQGILLPKDSNVMVDLISLHRNPSHFKDPLKFDPERFSAERSLELHPFAYLPFGYGKRDCIGQTYAMMAIKCSLSRIIKKFKVFPTEGLKSVVDIKFRVNITFVVDDMLLRFVVRENKESSYGVTAK